MKLKIQGTNKQKSAQYPEITDQLDAIWKIILQAELPIPATAKPLADKIQNVKATFKRIQFQGK